MGKKENKAFWYGFVKWIKSDLMKSQQINIFTKSKYQICFCTKFLIFEKIKS